MQKVYCYRIMIINKIIYKVQITLNNFNKLILGNNNKTKALKNQ